MFAWSAPVARESSSDLSLALLASSCSLVPLTSMRFMASLMVLFASSIARAIRRLMRRRSSAATTNRPAPTARQMQLRYSGPSARSNPPNESETAPNHSRAPSGTEPNPVTVKAPSRASTAPTRAATPPLTHQPEILPPLIFWSLYDISSLNQSTSTMSLGAGESMPVSARTRLALSSTFRMSSKADTVTALIAAKFCPALSCSSQSCEWVEVRSCMAPSWGAIAR